MKRVFISVLVVVITTFVVSSFVLYTTTKENIPIVPHPKTIIRDINIEQFTVLNVSTPIDVKLVRSTENRIEVLSDPNDKLVVEQKKKVLDIYQKNEDQTTRKNRQFKDNTISLVLYYTDDLCAVYASASATVMSDELLTAPKIELVASSSADLKLKVKTDTATLLASSSSSMHLDIQTDQLNVEASSSADVYLQGKALSVLASVSSSATFKGKDLEVSDAMVSASASGDCAVNALNVVRANASSGATIVLYGTPSDVVASASSGADIMLRCQLPEKFMPHTSSGGQVLVKKK